MKSDHFIYPMIKKGIKLLMLLLALCAIYQCIICAVTLEHPVSAPEHLAETIGVYSCVPLLLSIVLAYITRNVLLSISIGELVGLSMLSCITTGCSSFGDVLTAAVSVFFSDAKAILTTPFSFFILMMLLFVCGMVNTVNSCDGFLPLAERITQKIRSPKEANLIALLLGLLVSFDDYSCVLVVSPIMKPIVDKLNVSREKLAFIVDASAAPFSAVMIVSTWVSTEMMAINKGLELAGLHTSAYSAFFRSIPFSYYPLFCLWFIFIGGLLDKEYGPMLQAERRARLAAQTPKADKTNSADCPSENHLSKKGNVLVPLLPIIVFAAYTLAGFFLNGYLNLAKANALPEKTGLHIETLNLYLGSADTSFVMFQAALISSLLAIFLNIARKKQSAKKAFSCWAQGVKESFPCVTTLIITWIFAETINRLGAAHFIISLTTANVPYWSIPAMIFLVCCIISFAAGSIGTMLIAMPVAIPIASSFIESGWIASPEIYLSATIASVLAGALFGDHCSPITDTTILTSQSCGCTNIAHVKTQLPYALTIAAAATVSYLLIGFHILPVYSLLIGMGLILVIFLLLGKTP